MHSFTAFTLLVAFLPPTFGAPTGLRPIETVKGGKKANSYIITVKDGASSSVLAQKVKGDKTIFDAEFFNGFAAILDEFELNDIRSDPDVESVQEDGKTTTSDMLAQTDAPWGLQRISQEGRIGDGAPDELTFTYTYDSSAGAGVDVYVVDTGINTDHIQFEGRASFGAVFGGYPQADLSGHGTHVAGIIGASKFGIAKAANLISVKVLNDDGAGFASDIIAGLNFVMNQARSSGRPSVVNLSFGGSESRALDTAVKGLTNNGIHVVAAAGNESQDVNNVSPARSPDAITVAASDFDDALATFSNYGPGVDIIAPGVNIVSTSIGSPTSVATLSGTSMAAPHVAGLVAYFIAENGNVSPLEMASFIRERATDDVISRVPSGTLNKLANNDS